MKSRLISIVLLIILLTGCNYENGEVYITETITEEIVAPEIETINLGNITLQNAITSNIDINNIVETFDSMTINYGQVRVIKTKINDIITVNYFINTPKGLYLLKASATSSQIDKFYSNFNRKVNEFEVE